MLDILTTNEEIDIVTIHEVELLKDEEDTDINVRGYEQFSSVVRREVGTSGRFVDKIRTVTYVKEGIFDEVQQITGCSNGRSEVWLKLKNKGVKDMLYVSLYNEWKDSRPGMDNEDLMRQLKKWTSSDVFVHGDWNLDIDRIQGGDRSYAHYGIGLEILHKLERMGLDRHSSGPTREEFKTRGGMLRKESSAIDWAASNVPGIQHFSHRQIFSDHLAIVSDIPYTRSARGVEKVRVRRLGKLSSEECIDTLNNYDWEAMGSMTLEEMGSFLNGVMADVLERFAPMRWVKVKTKPKHVPSREERELRAQLNKSRERKEYWKLKAKQTKLRRCIRRNRIAQFERDVQNGKTDLWKAFKEVTKKAKTDVVLIDNGRRITGDPCAERFASFFADKIRKLKSACAPTIPKKKSREELLKNEIETFDFKFVSEDKVKKLIKDSKPSSATDLNGISPKMLKIWAGKSGFLLNAVRYVINTSIQSGKIPSVWKTSKLYPNFKGKGSRHETKSYRPIALANPICKIFEAAINEQLIGFLESRNILSQSQHGYRCGRSTISATAHLGDRVDEARQSGLYTGIICYDYSSAFDMIDSEILGGKLHNLGFGDTSVGLMTDYMRKRAIVVECSGGRSGTIMFESLSPQGSKISPTVYLAATHDINSEIEKITGCYSVTYADDTNVVCTAKTLSELKEIMERVCEKIQHYSSENGLCLNSSKTEFVIIRSKNSKLPDDFCVRFGDEDIKESESVRFLGVVTSRDMNGMDHLESITSEVNKRISMIRRLREYFTRKSLIHLVKSCVISKLLYASEIWCNVTSTHGKRVLERVEILMKKAIRAAMGECSRNGLSSEELWRRSGVEKPGRTILRRVAVAAFDIYNIRGNWTFLRRNVYFTAERDRRTPYVDQESVMAEAGSLRNRATRVQNCLPKEMRELSSVDRYHTLRLFKRLFNMKAEQIEETIRKKYFT